MRSPTNSRRDLNGSRSRVVALKRRDATCLPTCPRRRIHVCHMRRRSACRPAPSRACCCWTAHRESARERERERERDHYLCSPVRLLSRSPFLFLSRCLSLTRSLAPSLPPSTLPSLPPCDGHTEEPACRCSAKAARSLLPIVFTFLFFYLSIIMPTT